MKKLLVEGPNDKVVITNLLNKYGLTAFVDIEDNGGINNVLKTLKGLAVGSEITTIGIVVDADEYLDRRWQSIKDTLNRLGYADIPAIPEPSGTILRKEDKTIGIWIMPDNRVPGILEDFISFLVPNREASKLWQYAETCINNIPHQSDLISDEVRFAAKDRSKALIHTWLAWQQQPGYPLGTAVNKYLDIHTTQAQLFIAWVNTLFQSPL